MSDYNTMSIVVIIVIASSLFIPFAYGEDFPAMDMSRPLFVDAGGKELEQGQPGQQIMIVETISNNVYNDEQKPLVLIIDVRGTEGETIYLAFQTTSIGPNDSYSIGASWLIPNDASSGDAYSVRAFAITALGDNAQPLSTVADRDIVII